MGENAVIHFSAKAKVAFMNNTAAWCGGALFLNNGMLIVDSEVSLKFHHNSVYALGSSGAVLLENGKLIVNINANLTFTNNFAFYGGALELRKSTAHVDTNGI